MPCTLQPGQRACIPIADAIVSGANEFDKSINRWMSGLSPRAQAMKIFSAKTTERPPTVNDLGRLELCAMNQVDLSPRAGIGVPAPSAMILASILS
jgi:hypothetical protein